MNKKALHKISYGLYVISSKKEKKINGQIANAVFQVTSNPPTIAVSINKSNLTHEYIELSKKFSVSILDEQTPMKFIGKFGFKSGRDIEKFKDINYKLGDNTTPIIIDHTIACLEASVINQIESGTHTIFIGKITNADMLKDSNCLTYDYYHKVKGGYSPKTAPTYYEKIDKPNIEKKEENKMDKYVCTVCGYVYNPEKGDPDNGIEPGTKFNDLPKEWVCPICGAPLDAFEKQE